MGQIRLSLFFLETKFTLMNWGNTIIKGTTVDDGAVIGLTLNLYRDFKTSKNKILWGGSPREGQ